MLMREYQKYIKSSSWQRKKAEYYEENERVCENCGADSRDGFLDVHHKNYDRLGDENLDDLICLCRICHDLVKDEMEETRKKLTEEQEEQIRIFDERAVGIIPLDDDLQDQISDDDRFSEWGDERSRYS